MQSYFSERNGETSVSIEHPDLAEAKTYLLAMFAQLKLDVALPDITTIEILLSDQFNAFAQTTREYGKHISVSVVLSLALLKKFTRDEIMFVIGHEAWHILQPGHGYRVEENTCDLRSVDRLHNAGINGEAAINFWRKVANEKNHAPNSLLNLGHLLTGTHSSYENRIKHIQTHIGIVNQYGEFSDLPLSQDKVPTVVTSPMDTIYT